MGPLVAAIPAAFSAVFAGTATAGEAALALGTAATAVSTVAGAASAYSAYKTGAFQSAISKNNAAIEKQNASLALEQGAVAEGLQHTQTTRLIGAQEAVQGASGVDVGFGTPTQVREATQNVGDLDAQTVRYNSLLRSLGFQQQANTDLIQAKQAKQAGDLNAAGDILKATGSFISGGSSLASKYALMQQGGA